MGNRFNSPAPHDSSGGYRDVYFKDDVSRYELVSFFIYEYMPQNSNDHDRIINVEGKVSRLEKDVSELHNEYVSKDEFSPVRNLVYGLAGLLLTSVILAIFSLLIKR